ncbi:MAG TPA: hypothetical protein DIS79_01765 [Bacteroidetes bacterium]|nr:hypothetical protein [Bacteroidota bacterium]HRK05627.1 hypothetical protein [Chlorobiota bacterium]
MNTPHSKNINTSIVIDILRRYMMLILAVETMTGIILAFVFVPDYSPAIVSTQIDSSGRSYAAYGAVADVRGPVTYAYGTAADGSALMIDTVRHVAGRMLIPLDQLPNLRQQNIDTHSSTSNGVNADNISVVRHQYGDRVGQPIVPSVASVSLEVHLADTTLGTSVRRLHFALTSLLVGASMFLIVLLALQSVSIPFAQWAPAVAAVPVILLAAWSGRLLPDDLYAQASRNIVTSELGNIPFGTMFSALFGLDTLVPSPIRTYTMHCLVLPAVIWCLNRQSWKTLGHGSKRWLMSAGLFVVTTTFIVAVAPMSIDPDATLFRDAVQPQTMSHDVLPWWIVRPASTWSDVLGADLVGYLGVASFLAVVTIPLWRSRAPYRLPLLLIGALTGIYIVGIVL